jgi:2-polyprenyl-3-methyl-5-hydroxy-6-metoxy-1,4-benzoquinol methylase
MELSPHTVNQKYSDYIQPLNQNLFKLINPRLTCIDPNWTSKKILDYGCNIGHLLRTSENRINSNNYTGLDVQAKALKIAENDFPGANFILSNSYHPAFNKSGTAEFPIIQEKFDIIFCIGVFTHCDMQYIKQHINFFKQLLNEKGIIVFSIWEDFHYPRYLDFFLKFRLNVEVPKTLHQSFDKSLYLINRNQVILDHEALELTEVDWLETFYKRDYLLCEIENLKFLEGPRSLHSFFIIS